LLLEHKNDESLKKAGEIHQWKIPEELSGKFYHKFRIIMTGPNSSGNFVLALSGFEIYGNLEMPPLTAPKKQKTHRFAVVEVSNASDIVSQTLLSMSGMSVKSPPGCEAEFLEIEKEIIPLPQPSARQTSTGSTGSDVSSTAAPDFFEPASPEVKPEAEKNDIKAEVEQKNEPQPDKPTITETPITEQPVLETQPKIKEEEDRYMIEPIVSELEVTRFSELPDTHIAKDTFLKYLFLVVIESGKTEEKGKK